MPVSMEILTLNYKQLIKQVHSVCTMDNNNMCITHPLSPLKGDLGLLFLSFLHCIGQNNTVY